jgi:DNA-binding MarR family transcriptional regulator
MSESSPSIMDRLGIAFLTWRRYLHGRLVPHHITLKQSFVLSRLAQQEYLLPSQIARFLFCDRPTATVIVRNMERQDWVTRSTNPQDKRQKRVTITPAGRAKLREVNARVWQPVAGQIDPLGCFDQEEKAELERLLSKLNAHLRTITQEKPQ